MKVSLVHQIKNIDNGIQNYLKNGCVNEYPTAGVCHDELIMRDKNK